MDLSNLKGESEGGIDDEDSRERGVPIMLLCGRGALIPGLDRALLTMKVGERAEVTVAPEGGYGAGGSAENPVVPGSATLTYDIELLDVAEEQALWDLSYEAKMELAEERRQRVVQKVKGRESRA